MPLTSTPAEYSITGYADGIWTSQRDAPNRQRTGRQCTSGGSSGSTPSDFSRYTWAPCTGSTCSSRRPWCSPYCGVSAFPIRYNGPVFSSVNHRCSCVRFVVRRRSARENSPRSRSRQLDSKTCRANIFSSVISAVAFTVPKFNLRRFGASGRRPFGRTTYTFIIEMSTGYTRTNILPSGSVSKRLLR